MAKKSQQKGFSPVLIIIGAVVAATVLGAGYYFFTKQSGTIKTEKGEIQYQTSKNGQELVTKGEDGVIMVTGEDVKLPADYPGDLPQYPGSKNTMISYKPGDQLMMSIMGITNDSPQKVIDWYASELKRLGWTIEIQSTDSVNATKGNAFGGVNAITSDSDGTVINASIMPKDSVDMGTQNLDSGLQETKQMLNDAKNENMQGTEEIKYINQEGLDNSGGSGWEDVPLE